MTTSFKLVPLGAEFFDPFSGEDWRKVSDSEAMCLTGGDAVAGGRDVFALEDQVDYVRRDMAAP